MRKYQLKENEYCDYCCKEVGKVLDIGHEDEYSDDMICLECLEMLIGMFGDEKDDICNADTLTRQ